MDDSSSESSSPIASPTVASILGIKGPLRFRRHGAVQKAHVVLRRVEISDESSLGNNKASAAYFSLFAQKRIEVKPGKEILLAVASGDGSFTDQAVIFEGDLPGADSTSDEEDEVEKQIARDEPVPDSPSAHVVPPKMRRTWTRQFEQVSSIADTFVPPPRSLVSVGVQAQPSWSVSSVQTVPPASPLQEKPPPLALLAVEQAEEPSTTTEEAVEVSQAEASQELPSAPIDLILDNDRSRSLSPMSIGSPPSTPAMSPIVDRDASIVNIPVTPTQPSAKLPGDPSSTTNQALVEKQVVPWSHIEDAASRTSQISPVSSETVDMDLQSSPSSRSSASSDEIPGFITGAAARHAAPPMRLPQPLTPLVFPLVPSKQPSTGVTAPSPTVPVPRPVVDSTIQPPTTPVERHAVSSTPSAPFEPPASSVPAPPASKRPPIRNPFVSGGFMTEFVGGRDSLTTQKLQPSKELEVSSPSDSRLIADAHIPVKHDPVGIASPSASKLAQAGPQTLRVTVPERQPPMTPGQSPISVPSQSRQYTTLTSLPPRLSETAFAFTQNNSSSQARPGYYPIMSAHDSRLTYTATGTLSNPLNIRPSRFPPPVPQITPRVPSPPQVPRKKVIVGNGWPYNKQTNGHAIAPSVVSPPVMKGPLPPARPITPESTRSSTTPPGLSGITPYLSPSPPGFLHSSSSHKPRSTVDTLSNFSNITPTQRLSSTPQIKHGESDRPLMNLWAAYGSTPSEMSSPALPLPSQSPGGIDQQKIHIQAPRPIAPPSAASSVLQFSGQPSSASSTPSVDSKGKKRALATDDLDSSRPHKRTSTWPSQESVFSVNLKSDLDSCINVIAFSSDGERLAIICNDRSIRIWNMPNRVETARLAQTSPVLAVAWMTDDLGVVSLCQDGIIGKWTRNNQNHWQWAKLLDAGKEDSICFAYQRDRIAVAFPRLGVKVWIWIKGTWQPQRSILRQNVTSIKFVEDGEALIGGTSDGVLWYCQVPNGTLRAYAFLKSKVYHLDVNASGTHALVSQSGGRAHLVGIQQMDHKGKIEQVYALNSEHGIEQRQAFGAMFVNNCRMVLFGSIESNLLVWDKLKGEVVCGLDHGDSEQVQAVASFDRGANAYIVTGTKRGLLSWWKPPPPE